MTKMLPRLTVRLQGITQNIAPEPKESGPQLTIRLNGIVRSVIPLPSKPFHNEPSDALMNAANSDCPGPALDDLDDEDEDGEILKQVDQYLRNDNETETEDAPDWLLDADETLSPNPEYVFCPAAHRRQILHLFTRHFCLHPVFPERDGSWTAEEIRRNSVYEMYQFCYIRGLREVWGYLWACWYSPKMWRLWARSTTPYVSRLRTTMNVENFWRQLKHDHLHRFVHPRLDQLVWILIHKVTPAYMARAEILEDHYRLGRSKQLTTYQRYFKTAWKKLEKVQVSNRQYVTNVADWTCTCGRQKYDRHHLCKHLVQAVEPPRAHFWREVIRRRVKPIYQHPSLVAKGDNSPAITLSQDPGTISDGDDHILGVCWYRKSS